MRTERRPRKPDLVPAVLDDVRETLQMRWVDSALGAAAAHPMFFTAAWSAVRPNVGQTFLAAARGIRDEAASGAARTSPADHREWARRARLEHADVARIAATVRAFHESMPKVAIVVHALARAARGRPAGGKGTEEAPPKRGVPAWHPAVTLEAPEEAEEVLGESARRLGGPRAPDVMVALAQWPGYLSRAWRDTRRAAASDPWRAAAARIRRQIAEAVRGLPHVISLQWGALKERGFDEEARRDVGDVMAAYDAAMPNALLVGAYLWVAAGSPDGSRDGSRPVSAAKSG